MTNNWANELGDKYIARSVGLNMWIRNSKRGNEVVQKMEMK